MVEDQSALVPRYEPNHPAANADGYVYYPNVNVVEEMADMISASRAFQTNVEMMNTAKQMRVPRTARSSNQSILKEINPEYSLE